MVDQVQRAARSRAPSFLTTGDHSCLPSRSHCLRPSGTSLAGDRSGEPPKVSPGRGAKAYTGAQKSCERGRGLRCGTGFREGVNNCWALGLYLPELRDVLGGRASKFALLGTKHPLPASYEL